MKKDCPCLECGRNIEEAVQYDEVTCYRSCAKWLEWRKKENEKLQP